MNVASALAFRAISADGFTFARAGEVSGTGLAVPASFAGEFSGLTIVDAPLFSLRSPRKSGNRHLPSAFCGQTTFGPTSDTSLITKRLEKIEKKAIRRPKFSASR